MSYKNTAKLITFVFAVLIIVQTFGFLIISISEQHASAEIPFTPNVDIPGMPRSIDGSSIGEYVKVVYNYAIGSVGILSTVVMTFGGILWITSAGNTSRVEKAKATIAASLTGLILALSSYTLLHIVNPDLLNFKPLDVRPIDTEEVPDLPGLVSGITVNPNAEEFCEGLPISKEANETEIQRQCASTCFRGDKNWLVVSGSRIIERPDEDTNLLCCTCQDECYGKNPGDSCRSNKGYCYGQMINSLTCQYVSDNSVEEGDHCGTRLGYNCMNVRPFTTKDSDDNDVLNCPPGFIDGSGGRTCGSGWVKCCGIN